MGFIDEAIKWLKDLWDKDSNKILTAATVMGVGVVAVESFKAGERCEQKKPLIEAEIKEKEEKLGKPLTKMECPFKVFLEPQITCIAISMYTRIFLLVFFNDGKSIIYRAIIAYYQFKIRNSLSQN